MTLRSLQFTVIFKSHMMTVGWLCFMSHRQSGHLEMAPKFTVPCEGHEARFFYTVHIGNRTLGPLH